jgi:chromate transporter
MSVTLPPRPLVDPAEITLAELFVGFLKVALSGFGGVIAWARRMMVEDRRWLSEEEFIETLSLCQFLPGPNIVNVAVCVGLRFRGPLGAAASLAGVILVPFVLILILGVLYLRYGHIAELHGALAGLSAAAAGLIIAMGVKMGLPHRRRPAALVFGGLAFLAVAILQWPLVPVLLVLALPSVILARLSRA